MCDEIVVVSVNVSKEKGTVKIPVACIHVDERGVVGDAHAGARHRQVSILSMESIDRFAGTMGRTIKPGEFAENLTVSGIDLSKVAVLDRFRIGSVELEVMQIGKECHGEGCAIFQEVGKCVMPKEGIFCRVLAAGKIEPGDVVEYLARPLKIAIITVSDRASRGEYEDRSGPRIRQLLEVFVADKRLHPEYSSATVPDEPEMLRRELSKALDEKADVIITTGGTGIGPRDITPEVVMEFCEKTIPGIMESIRLKYGAQKPNALLSRSIAGAVGKTQVYTLPGSVRAVEEYMTEILKTLEHVVYMIHGLDVH